MRLLHSIIPTLLIASAQRGLAASSWSFEDATLTVSGKGAGVGGGAKEKLSATVPLPKTVALGGKDTLRIVLTTTEDKKAKRPHQAFLTLTEPSSGLEESFPLTLKENGKGKVEVTQKDLPTQLVTSAAPLKASLIVASFGSSKPYRSPVFTLAVEQDPAAPITIPEPPIRYRALEEIRHIFRSDPSSPPIIITLVFTIAVIAALPAVLGLWLTLGGNGSHFGKAMNAAPVSHALFVGSIVAMEGIFFLYYTTWNLFQTLPAAAAVGVVAFLSGSRALSEVQERRLDGLR
ncbi:hypothetical protein EJ05DRAFT_141004 [Pseudovirgaria hyperparasitica]|uniref:Ribophorin II C-terminal domain-containing protein n=1 Tax=Pseudovirgaria hyperparasitica TaxID=470096 RepID=A0A6A6VYN0_9PEZI|nr:uncharacterized protein EJ05DRAFT_141004 [Pseudovirgaria hyperparasitica]KAF2754417.1 hypothetical protein EJ05DRAFT_141004 [Pseudovirgaria hyperparasitica]